MLDSNSNSKKETVLFIEERKIVKLEKLDIQIYRREFEGENGSDFIWVQEDGNTILQPEERNLEDDFIKRERIYKNMPWHYVLASLVKRIKELMTPE